MPHVRPLPRPLASLALLLVALPLADARPQGATERVSLRSLGLQGSQRSLLPALSADGRYVAFESYAPELVPGDTNGTWDVFRRDRVTGEVLRISVGAGGQEANGASLTPAISADGQLVAFESLASNLVAGDSNHQSDVFVHDCTTGLTTRVSVDSSGQQSSGPSSRPALSGDGRHVAFLGLAGDLVPGDTNAAWDVFVHDLPGGTTRRVSVASAGMQADGHSLEPALSHDGRWIAFASEATNLVAGDTNGVEDVFVHDAQSGLTTRVSVGSGGAQSNGYSEAAALSADGRWVGFYSEASNLVAGDGNGRGDVFVRDLQSGQTLLVSAAAGGGPGSGASFGPSLSGDGQRVAFESDAPDLVPGDTNARTDLFVRDLQGGATTRVSVSSAGTQANGASHAASLAADGSHVAFHSDATDLATADLSTLEDVFVHDSLGGTTSMESVCGPDLQSAGECFLSMPSGEGRWIAFASTGDDLVAADTNAASDVFLRDRLSGVTTRVSVSSSGAQADAASATPFVSADGRCVAFDSWASNLDPGDTNGTVDPYVHDRVSGTTERVSVGSGGVGADGASEVFDLSPDGGHVAFHSLATNLVAGDSNGTWDVFVRDRAAGLTERVSLGSTGVQGNGPSEFGSISADGRFVAFHSSASNLVAGDTNRRTDCFVRDRQLGLTTRVSLGSLGVESDGNSVLPRLSADGRYVAFVSVATNLVAGDTNGVADAFVHDRSSGQTRRVSLGSLGAQADGSTELCRISGDGRFVVFLSQATNLVPGDTNGAADVFVHELASAQTLRVSVDSSGAQADAASSWPALSFDGRFASFASAATDLVADDTNAADDVFLHDLRPEEPIAFCYGDGSEGACPCGNGGATGRGCDNAQATGGVLLSASGTPSANDVVLHGSGFPPAATPGVTLIRSPSVEAAPVPFGDGLRCLGTSGLVRIGASLASGGVSTHPLDHGAGPGTFHYQLWYRSSPASFCVAAAAFNLSNGLSIVWP